MIELARERCAGEQLDNVGFDRIHFHFPVDVLTGVRP